MSVSVAELATLSLLLFAWPAAGTDSYINTFGEEVAFDCDVGQALSRFESSRESQSSRPTRKRSGSDHFDRLWDLSCSPVSFLRARPTMTNMNCSAQTDREQSEGVLPGV